jgi:Sulfatase
MTDQTAGVGESAGGQGVLVVPYGRWQLRPATIRAIAVATSTIILAYFWQSEGFPSNVLFTAATTLVIASLVVVLTRRVLFATALTASLVVLVVEIARAKLETLGMVLHAYDFVFYLTSWSTVSYLWDGARLYVLALLFGLTACTFICWLAFRLDSTRVSRLRSGTAAAIFTVLAMLGASFKGERPHTLFYWEALYVSSFFSSWSETLETFWRGQLVEAAASAPGRLFNAPASCHPVKKPPHIILIHEESVVQPGLFPTLQYDRGLDDFFRSADGKVHRLRVETYGGASWLTEFSILAGMSTQSFGGMRHFVQSLLAGKVRETLPEWLLQCGYRNVVFYPMLKNFVSNARFYEAIGLKEIFDLTAQKARSVVERDKFYYLNALDEMDRHIRTQDKPLFTYIQTMSGHWPYNEPFHPEIGVSGGGPGTHPEMHEYLRRIGIAKLDYEFLRSELKRRFPNEPILIVHYGDHHPMATRMLLGFNEVNEVEDIKLSMESIGLITYYAVDALNYSPPQLPPHDTLDVAYLGATILEQAGLPLTDAWRERLRLMAVCGGRYYGCARRDEILAFHRRLIDSGLMEAR